MARPRRTKEQNLREFWNRVDKRPKGCWVWKASNNRGYGNFINDEGSHIYAHIYSYLIHVGPIPDGMLVLHECDNKLCVRPLHLFLGTHADNSKDMVEKGRSFKNKGSSNGNSKLTERGAKLVRGLFRKGWRRKDIAELLEVTRGTVEQCINEVTWTHI